MCPDEDEDHRYNGDGEDDKYKGDDEDALDLVTQVHSERMTTIGMGRVRVLVRKKPSIRKQQLVREKNYPCNFQLPKANHQYTVCE